MAYGIGPVSGCHVNPAVSFAAFLADRMTAREMGGYWVAQVAGAVAGAGLLALVAKTGVTNLGRNWWGEGYLGQYSLQAAAIFEVAMTAIFVMVILGVSGDRGHGPFAGVAIGITLAAIHIVGIQVTGVSVNPARIIGPALLVGGTALDQVWLFIVAPLAGAAVGACLYRFGVFEPKVAPPVAVTNTP